MNKNSFDDSKKFNNQTNEDSNIKKLNLTPRSNLGKLNEMYSIKSDEKIRSDPQDIRKKFDLFIKNINEQTKNNLMDSNRRRSEALNIDYGKRSNFKKSNLK